MTDNERELGRFETLLDELSKDVAKANQRLDDITASVNGVQVMLAEFRGGWKTLTILSGLAGAFIGALVSFAAHIGGGLFGNHP